MASESLTPTLQETLSLFDTAGSPLTTPEIADQLPIGRRSTYERLERLVSVGRLDTKKVGANGRVWWRPVVKSEDKIDHHSDEKSRQGIGQADGRYLYRESSTVSFETLFEHSPDMIDVLDPTGRLLDVNQRLCTELGYTEPELLGKGIWEYDQAISKAGVCDLLSEFSVGESRKFEARYQRADGSTFPVEVNLIRLDRPSEDRFLAISRNITDRKHREEALHDRIQQQEAVTELGKHALEGIDLDELMAEASRVVAETLGNDYCKVLDLDRETDELLLRQGVGWNAGIVGSSMVSAVENESQASYTLQTAEPVVVSDLSTESRFSGPDLLTDHDVRSGISTIIGPLERPWGTLGTHDTECTEFTEYDANFVQSIANILAAAVTRHQSEQQLISQREHGDALNELNAVIREITTAVIEQSTREEIEATVCDQLAATDSYQLAWIGEADTASETVDIRTESGMTGYTDEISISLDEDYQLSSGPTGRAFQTGTTQVVNDIPFNTSHDPWRESAEAYGFRSSAAIPIVHEGTIYSVLNIYADRLNAFEQQERDVIEQLGESIGHAIAATERKQALTSTELTELEFRIRNLEDVFDGITDLSGTLTLDSVVPITENEFLVYGTATDEAIESITQLVEVLSHWQAVEFKTTDEPISFELRLSDAPILSVIASYGGYIDSAVIENGNYRMTVHLSPSADVSEVASLVRQAYPQVRMLRRQQITKRQDTARQIQGQLTETLTARQSTVLETAYHAGYFEWPRNNSAQDVAASLGVAPATFHQHLRKALKQVFDELLSTTSVTRIEHDHSVSEYK